MSAPRVVRSSQAQDDIRRIFAWIALDSGEDRATGVLERFDRVIERLAVRPRLGRVRSEYQGDPRGFSAPPWRILSRPLPDGDGVRILRILDSRRDIAALMGKKS
jgi:toxin ParE1/3/4